MAWRELNYAHNWAPNFRQRSSNNPDAWSVEDHVYRGNEYTREAVLQHRVRASTPSYLNMLRDKIQARDLSIQASGGTVPGTNELCITVNAAQALGTLERYSTAIQEVLEAMTEWSDVFSIHLDLKSTTDRNLHRRIRVDRNPDQNEGIMEIQWRITTDHPADHGGFLSVADICRATRAFRKLRVEKESETMPSSNHLALLSQSTNFEVLLLGPCVMLVDAASFPRLTTLKISFPGSSDANETESEEDSSAIEQFFEGIFTLSLLNKLLMFNISESSLKLIGKAVQKRLVCLYFLSLGLRSVNEEAVNALLEGMKSNTSIMHFSWSATDPSILSRPYYRQATIQLEHYVKLNRAGRRYLVQDDDSSAKSPLKPGLIPALLNHASTIYGCNGVFFLLREYDKVRTMAFANVQAAAHLEN